VAVTDIADWLRERGLTERSAEEVAYVIEHPRARTAWDPASSERPDLMAALAESLRTPEPGERES
jgi:hypothetical protein